MSAEDPSDDPEDDPFEQLRVFWNHGGYVRRPNPERRGEGHQAYKKGWELRFVLDKADDAFRILELLQRAGVPNGRAFRKNGRIVLPVYGREAVTALLARLEPDRAPEPEDPPGGGGRPNDG